MAGKKYLTVRRQKYKANRLAGMNQVNSARAAGYSEVFSRTASDRLERSIKVDMRDHFERAGLTDKKIVEHALKGLNAGKVISANVIASDGMADAHGTTKDFIDVPDWTARHKYFETILKITDKLRDKVIHSGAVASSETKIVIVRADGQEVVPMKKDINVFNKTVVARA